MHLLDVSLQLAQFDEQGSDASEYLPRLMVCLQLTSSSMNPSGHERQVEELEQVLQFIGQVMHSSVSEWIEYWPEQLDTQV